MPSPELVIFDCDGVLVDSEIIAARVESRLLAEAGYTISVEEMNERYAGMTFPDILRDIERVSGLPLQASLIGKSDKAVDEALGREVRAIDGAARALMAAGPNVCVCSNSSMKRLAISLNRTGLAPLVQGRVFSALDLEGVEKKPAPDVFLYAAREMGADPANTFVIEDSVAGVTGARAAGMRVIGFTGASHSYPGHADRLTETGAETVINRLSDLKAVIGALAEFGTID